MIFDSNDTRDIEDLSNLAHPAPAWWKVAGVALLGIIGIAVAAVQLGGCGPSDSVDRGEAPMYEEGAPAVAGIESTSSPIVSGGFFGNSGYGTNFECKSYGCYCDPAPGSGMGGMTTDCKDMQKAGVCDPGSTLVCGATASRAICQCIKRGQMLVTCPTSECPISSNALPAGYNGDGQNAFYRLPDSDRSCWVPWSLVPFGTFVQTRTGERLASLVASYSGQRCTPEEQRGSTVMTSGYFQTPDTVVHFKANRRSCEISARQWGIRRITPPITQQSAAAADDHRSYLGCTDRELIAAGFLP